jgi:hypothetical protein
MFLIAKLHEAFEEFVHQIKHFVFLNPSDGILAVLG